MFAGAARGSLHGGNGNDTMNGGNANGAGGVNVTIDAGDFL